MNAGGHGTAQERRVDRAWRLTIEALGSVKTIYRSAWSMTPGKEKIIHVFLDAAVSVIAPAAVVWAALDTHISFPGRYPIYFKLILAVVPPVLFVLACHFLKKKYAQEDHAPLLAFAVLLFSAGAVFTAQELAEHTGQHTIPCIRECVNEEGLTNCVLEPRGCKQPDQLDNPPWGDFLLAFSAFCVMIEEFVLFRKYDDVSRRVKQAEKLTEKATESRNKLIELTKDTAEKYRELTELNKQANTLYRNMARQAEEWNESRRAVLLKACGLVAIIVLAFTAMCGRV